MKKVFTPAVLFLFALVQLNAQITVNEEDVPVVYDVVIEAIDTVVDASITVGANGSTSWDYSALMAHDTVETFFVEIVNTPHAGTFPSSNLVAFQNGGTYTYFSKTSERLEVLGTSTSLDLDTDTLDLIIKYDNPATLIEFPCTYQTTFTDTSKFSIGLPGSILGIPAVDSVAFGTTTYSTTEVDAFGELTTPLGTFDVIRLKTEDVSFDTTSFFFGGFSTVEGDSIGILSTDYTFWASQNGINFPVATLNLDSTGIVGVNWLFDFTSSTQYATPTVDFQIGPNPTSEFMNLELKEDFQGSMEIVDFNGKLVFQQPLNTYKTNITTAGFLPGQYVLVLKSENGQLAGFKRFQVIR